jgi:hypothetical protein
VRSVFESLVVGALVLVAPSASADPPSTSPDSTYGRIDGDMALVGGVGASFGPTAPRLALDLRFRYLDTVGVFVDYEDAPAIGSKADPRRVFSTGLELRPLFLARWLQLGELHRTRLDLLVDSFGLELGAVFQQATGTSFGQRPGVQAGVGLEVPIFAHATGPWIGFHGGVRWSDAVISGGPIDGPGDRALYLAVTLSWHQLFLTHAVDAGDRPPQ